MTNLKKHFEKALGSTLVVNGGVVGAVMTGALMGNYPIGLGAIICAASVATSFGAALATAKGLSLLLR